MFIRCKKCFLRQWLLLGCLVVSGGYLVATLLLLLAVRAEAVTTTVSTVSHLGNLSSPTTLTAQPTTLTGKVELRGGVPAASSILVLVRPAGTKKYTAVQRLPAVGQAAWVWPAAVAGQAYEVTATYQVQEKNVVVDCGQMQDGRWWATVQVPTVSTAPTYWIQAGTRPGSTNLVNSKVLAQPQAATSFWVVDGQNFYVRYAYAYSQANAHDTNYSAFSPSLYARCP